MPPGKRRANHGGTQHEVYVGSIRLLITRTILVFYPIRNNPQTLVACHGITQFHLNVAKELVFCDPATAMRDFQVTCRYFGHCPRACSCDPKIGRIFPGKHGGARCEIHRAAVVIVMRATQRTIAPIIEAVDRHPGNSLIPRQLEHIHGRKCGLRLRGLVDRDE